MLTLTCHSCEVVMEADTETDLMALGMDHAIKHGHTPPPEHVLARIRKQNAGRPEGTEH